MLWPCNGSVFPEEGGKVTQLCTLLGLWPTVSLRGTFPKEATKGRRETVIFMKMLIVA